MKQTTPLRTQHLGIVIDRPPEEVEPNAWTGGSNVQFMNGATARVGGYQPWADPLPTLQPLFAMNVIIGPDSYWLYCTVDKVWVTNGLIHWDITKAGGMATSEAGDWSGCILNGIPCINNGSDAPMYWDLNTSHPVATLPGWPSGATCKSLRATKYHLMALNISEANLNYGSQVWWSSAAAAGALPQEWTPTASNDAGDTVCGDSPGDIIDGLALRDVFIVYKAFSTYIMQYVAGTYVFTTRKLFDTTGIQALNCAVEVNGTHYVFTGTDVIRHDGQSYVSVADDKVKLALVQSIEPSKTKMCQVEARILEGLIWVCIPETGHSWLSKAYILDTQAGDWGIRVLPDVAHVARGIVADTGIANNWDADNESWDSDTTFWDQQTYSPTQDSMLMADAVHSKLLSVDSIETANGAPVYAWVEKLGAIINADGFGHQVVTAVIPRIEGMEGEVLQITLGGQPWFDRPITWGVTQEYIIGTDHQVNDIVEGRLLALRIEGTTQGVWRLYSYSIKTATMGEF